MSEEAAFWDTSALVPLCVIQRTSPEAGKLLERYSPVVWWGAVAEIHSAVWRVVRSGEIDETRARQAIETSRWLQTVWQEIMPDELVREMACALLEKYPLRAADSLQLAAAMAWCGERPEGRKFLCSDRRLSEAARAAGFSVVEI